MTSDEITIDNLIDSPQENSNLNSELLKDILEDEKKRKIFDSLIDSNNNDDWIERTEKNVNEINYFLRINAIKTKEKNQNNSRYRKYTFTELGSILKKEYINKTLHNNV